MLYKNKKSRKTIPGYSLIPKGDHYQVKKITLTGERVKTDPAFMLTRTCAGEFGKAARLGKLIRSAIVKNTGIKAPAGRLTGELFKSLGANPATCIGDRDFSTAWFDNLVGFNFNQQEPWDESTTIMPEVIANVRQKRIIVRLPACIPEEVLTPPEGVTHCHIYTVTAAISCKEGYAETVERMTTRISIKNIRFGAKQLTTKLEQMEHRLIIMAMGICWYTPNGIKGVFSLKPPGPLSIIYMKHH